MLIRGINELMLATAILLLWLGQRSCASPTNTLRLHFTARDFMPAGCMRPKEIEVYWPGDAAVQLKNPRWIDSTSRCPIKADILDGIYSGHPDFETGLGVSGTGCSGTRDSLFYDAGVPNLTLASGGVPCESYSTTGATGVAPIAMTKVVESYLEYHMDGIPKPVYCKNGPYLKPNDLRCGWTLNSTPGSESLVATSGKTMFDKWYRDDPRFSKRIGFELELTEANSGIYSYASGNFHPLNNAPSCTTSAQARLDCSNGGKIWPRAVMGPLNSPYDERTDPRGTFAFTTEMHGFFTFQGNETLEFRGDDDVWIFINGQLALDVGGLHAPARSVISLASPDVQLRLGLTTIGEAYALDIFHAERRTTGSSFGLTTSMRPGCTVRDAAKPEFIQSPASVSSSQQIWKISGCNFNDTTGNLVLMTKGQTYTSSYAFMRRRVNVGPGFIASFSFKTDHDNQGTDGGFAFVIHRAVSGLDNINGGTGPNLGFSNWRLSNTLGVAFNFSGPDTMLSLTSNSLLLATAPLYHPNLIRDNQRHTVSVRFYGLHPPWIEVYLDGDLFIQKRDVNLTDSIFRGSTSAWAGFTASSGFQESPNIEIGDFQIETVAIEDAHTLPMHVVSNSNARDKQGVRIDLKTYDACNNSITFGGYADKINVSILPSAFNRQLLASEITVEKTDLGEGTYRIQLFSEEVATYNLSITFGSFIVFDNLQISFSEPLPTPSPTIDEIELPSRNDNLVLIAIASGSIFTVFFCMMVLGCYFRRKWKKAKAFIDSGKEAVAEKDVIYQGDPALDDLQRRVQLSFQALNRERAREKLLADQEIEKLLEEIREIKSQIARLQEGRINDAAWSLEQRINRRNFLNQNLFESGIALV